jgi:hypothetical protein
VQQYKLSRFWEGYKLPATRNDQKRPSFRVSKTYSISKWDSTYEVELGLDKNKPYNYKIKRSACKSSYKISDKFGVIIAEVRFQFSNIFLAKFGKYFLTFLKLHVIIFVFSYEQLRRKKSTCGIDLGDDVYTMVVEPNIDLSLIMGVVVAYNLIKSKM